MSRVLGRDKESLPLLLLLVRELSLAYQVLRGYAKVVWEICALLRERRDEYGLLLADSVRLNGNVSKM